MEIKRQEATWAKSFLVYYHWFYKYISGLYEGDLDFLIKAIKIKSYGYSFEHSWSDTGLYFYYFGSEIEFVLFGTRDWNWVCLLTLLSQQALIFHGNDSFRYRGLKIAEPKNGFLMTFSALEVNLLRVIYRIRTKTLNSIYHLSIVGHLELFPKRIRRNTVVLWLSGPRKKCI